MILILLLTFISTISKGVNVLIIPSDGVKTNMVVTILVNGVNNNNVLTIPSNGDNTNKVLTIL